VQLKLKAIEVECIIGDRPEERDRLQNLRVNVELEIDEAVAESDRLADTVDYVALVARIRRALAFAKCRMIERAAKIVADECLHYQVVREAKASVIKCGTVPKMDSAEAVYVARR